MYQSSVAIASKDEQPQIECTNGPPIHEVDFSKYVKLWEGEKHQLALYKSGGEQRVLERMSAKHKHTILSDLNNK